MINLGDNFELNIRNYSTEYSINLFCFAPFFWNVLSFLFCTCKVKCFF